MTGGASPAGPGTGVAARRAWEDTAAGFLRRAGFVVVRAARPSYVAADLVAFRALGSPLPGCGSLLLLCQVRRVRTRAGRRPGMSQLTTRADWNALFELASHAGGVPLLIGFYGQARSDRLVLRVTGLRGADDGAAAPWPCVPFQIPGEGPAARGWARPA